jgi:hypothetical protein
MTDEREASRAHVYQSPELATGYDASDEPLVETADAPAPPVTGDERGRDNRGRRAGVTEAGEVVGSGAGAGGKGNAEDFDVDPQAGGGTYLLGHPDRPNRGGDASQHNSS